MRRIWCEYIAGLVCVSCGNGKADFFFLALRRLRHCNKEELEWNIDDVTHYFLDPVEFPLLRERSEQGFCALKRKLVWHVQNPYFTDEPKQTFNIVPRGPLVCSTNFNRFWSSVWLILNISNDSTVALNISEL